MNLTQAARRELRADAEWRRQQATRPTRNPPPHSRRSRRRLPLYLLPMALLVRGELLLIRSAVNAGPRFWRRAMTLCAFIATYVVAVERGLIP